MAFRSSLSDCAHSIPDPVRAVPARRALRPAKDQATRASAAAFLAFGIISMEVATSQMRLPRRNPLSPHRPARRLDLSRWPAGNSRCLCAILPLYAHSIMPALKVELIGFRVLSGTAGQALLFFGTQPQVQILCCPLARCLLEPRKCRPACGCTVVPTSATRRQCSPAPRRR